MILSNKLQDDAVSKCSKFDITLARIIYPMLLNLWQTKAVRLKHCLSNIYFFSKLPTVQWHLSLKYEVHKFYRQTPHIIFLVNRSVCSKKRFLNNGNISTKHSTQEQKQYSNCYFIWHYSKNASHQIPKIMINQTRCTAKFFQL